MSLVPLLNLLPLSCYAFTSPTLLYIILRAKNTFRTLLNPRTRLAVRQRYNTAKLIKT